MSMAFNVGEKPDSAYEAWRANWQPPVPRPLAMPGKVIVEFGPYGNRGLVWTPEKNSYNAMVVSDGCELRPGREGHLSPGIEIGFTGTESRAFTYQGRELHVVSKAQVEMCFPKEDAA